MNDGEAALLRARVRLDVSRLTGDRIGEETALWEIEGLEERMGNFHTDVILKDPRHGSAARCSDMALLEPVTRAKVQAILVDLKKNGQHFECYETFRSQVRQEELYHQGATQLSHAGCHGYGVAADIVRVVNGQPSWDGDFSMLWHLAHVHGLITGKDWGHPERHHSFVDAPHVQRVSVHDQAALFAGTFYPDASYDPYKHLGSTTP